jgi:2'-hydroxyisoflavone reductase
MATTRVLILGGTEFVGRAFVDEALARGHDVTVLNRGTREPRADVTTVVGDRTRPGGLDAVAGGSGTSWSTPGRGRRGR